MTNFNKVILMGHLTRDLELKSINNGNSFVELGIAVNERRKAGNGNWKDEVHFVNVTFWGKNAEIISQYLSKGDPVLVEGRLKQNRWETDNRKHSRITVTGEQFSFVGPRQHGSEVIMQSTDLEHSNNKRDTIADDDIPF
ncbi:MAG: single-stranded DNA-binding protein [Planctomycetaceae bacterium]|nr:single-stranded DNA-binding protein [Planctomycetaceae bacterium]|tara:strand:- start:4169 stop:4588 length:420 start_codon:yes stop_codon:yes gene_type:complete